MVFENTTPSPYPVDGPGYAAPTPSTPSRRRTHHRDLAISVGANGISGAFGHLFLSDLVAESVGWPTDSPFQLGMDFANLTPGALGFLAVGRRGGFRIATIIAVAVIGFGATTVHLLDIAATGNLAPDNTIQNVSTVTDPVLLMGLTWMVARRDDPDADSPEFERWQQRHRPIATLEAAGIGTGFGLGFAVGGLLLWTGVGAAVGLAIGVRISRRIPGGAPGVSSWKGRFVRGSVSLFTHRSVGN